MGSPDPQIPIPILIPYPIHIPYSIPFPHIPHPYPHPLPFLLHPTNVSFPNIPILSSLILNIPQIHFPPTLNNPPPNQTYVSSHIPNPQTPIPILFLYPIHIPYSIHIPHIPHPYPHPLPFLLHPTIVSFPNPLYHILNPPSLNPKIPPNLYPIP